MQRIDRIGERGCAMTGEDYFNQVYHSTVRELHKFIIVKTSNAENVEDILQEVYKAFYIRVMKKGYSDIHSPKAFLTKAAQKELARHYKRKAEKAEHVEPGGLDEAIEVEGIHFEQLIDNRQALRRAYEVVKGLPLLSYKAFMLFYSYDMSTTQIAGQLGVTEKNVRTRLWRARNAVRKEVKL